MIRQVRVLITGSRDWTDQAVLWEALDHVYLNECGHPSVMRVVHGAARGADSLAQAWYEDRLEMGWAVMIERHPALWNSFGRRAGILRNIEMVKLGADVCLAFPLGESKGTRHCMAQASSSGIPVRVFSPRVAHRSDADLVET